MSAFDKVIGYEEIKLELRRYADILKNPDKYAKLGVNMPSGLMLYGEPGLGKSLMAKCFIEASGCKAFILRKEKPNGEFVVQIKEIFEQAKAEGPSIVYLDDMDKFANEDERHTDQLKAIKSLSEVTGIGGIYWGGSIGSMRPMADKKVKARAKKYIKTNISTDKGIIEEITEKLAGVKWCDGITPGNIFVVPEGFDINTITPVQDCELGKLTKTHFRHYELDKSMMQLKIYGTKMPTWLKKLKDATGFSPEDIPFNDVKVMESLSEEEAINIIGEFVCYMQPKRFSDILRSFGFNSGTGTWDCNAERLINDKGIPVHECIAFREDILQTLEQKGMDRELAFEIMEAVRTGRGLKKEWIESMRSFNIPNWYIDSCKKIRYLFSRASGISYALAVYRLMYYRYYYPEEYACVMNENK